MAKCKLYVDNENTLTFLQLRSLPTMGMHTTKVFSKVLADGRNSAILLSFGSIFGRPNNMGK